MRRNSIFVPAGFLGSAIFLVLIVVFLKQQWIHAQTSPRLLAFSPCEIIAVNYTNRDMIVTCQAKDGTRFNLLQTWNDPKIPIPGETWTLQQKTESSRIVVLKERVKDNSSDAPTPETH